MATWRLSVFGCLCNLIISSCIILQTLKSFSIAYQPLKAEWQRKMVYLGCLSSVIVNPILLAIGFFGDFKTIIVSCAYIALVLLLILDFFTSYSFIKNDGFSDDRISRFRKPSAVCFYGFSTYVILKMMSIALVLLF